VRIWVKHVLLLLIGIVSAALYLGRLRPALLGAGVTAGFLLFPLSQEHHWPSRTEAWIYGGALLAGAVVVLTDLAEPIPSLATLLALGVALLRRCRPSSRRPPTG
jgi:hypothetical protein